MELGVWSEFATVIATHYFDPRSLGIHMAKSRTLLVCKGDKFKVLSVPCREWWGARCTSNDNIGYIPSAYVLPATQMDVAAIGMEVKINARAAKQTSNGTTTSELDKILSARHQGRGAPIKSKKQYQEFNSMVSPELQKVLEKRNKIAEEGEQQKDGQNEVEKQEDEQKEGKQLEGEKQEGEQKESEQHEQEGEQNEGEKQKGEQNEGEKQEGEQQEGEKQEGEQQKKKKKDASDPKLLTLSLKALKSPVTFGRILYGTGERSTKSRSTKKKDSAKKKDDSDPEFLKISLKH